jgi:hypothetical protein
MTIQLHDIKSGFIVVAAGATLVAMVAFVFKHFFRSFTFRKDLSVPFYERFGTPPKLSGVAVAPTPASVPTPAPPPLPEPVSAISGNVTEETSPIDPLEATALFTMLASEEVLRRDWDSPEEDEAWAHL